VSRSRQSTLCCAPRWRPGNDPSFKRLDLLSQRLDLSVLPLHGSEEHARVAVQIDHVPVASHGRGVGAVLDDEPQVAAPGVGRETVLVGGEAEIERAARERIDLVGREVVDVLLRSSSRYRTLDTAR
jgi:hypothetical protein